MTGLVRGLVVLMATACGGDDVHRDKRDVPAGGRHPDLATRWPSVSDVAAKEIAQLRSAIGTARGSKASTPLSLGGRPASITMRDGLVVDRGDLKLTIAGAGSFAVTAAGPSSLPSATGLFSQAGAPAVSVGASCPADVRGALDRAIAQGYQCFAHDVRDESLASAFAYYASGAPISIQCAFGSNCGSFRYRYPSLSGGEAPMPNEMEISLDPARHGPGTGCGSLEATLFHELLHSFLVSTPVHNYGERTEDQVFACEAICFGGSTSDEDRDCCTDPSVYCGNLKGDLGYIEAEKHGAVMDDPRTDVYSYRFEHKLCTARYKAVDKRVVKTIQCRAEFEVDEAGTETVTCPSPDGQTPPTTETVQWTKRAEVRATCEIETDGTQEIKRKSASATWCLPADGKAPVLGAAPDGTKFHVRVKEHRPGACGRPDKNVDEAMMIDTGAAPLDLTTLPTFPAYVMGTMSTAFDLGYAVSFRSDGWHGSRRNVPLGVLPQAFDLIFDVPYLPCPRGVRCEGTTGVRWAFSRSRIP